MVTSACGVPHLQERHRDQPPTIHGVVWWRLDWTVRRNCDHAHWNSPDLLTGRLQDVRRLSGRVPSIGRKPSPPKLRASYLVPQIGGGVWFRSVWRPWPCGL